MMTGEMDFDDIFFNSGERSVDPLVWVIFILLVIILNIILMNLLVRIIIVLRSKLKGKRIQNTHGGIFDNPLGIFLIPQLA